MIIPSKKQYIDVIRNGNDSIHKKVVLHLNGKFEIVPNDKFDFDSDYVGRSETLDAYNDYVGIEASKDQNYIDKSYAMFLKAWIRFIKNGVTKQYLDVYGSETIEDLLEEIKNINNNNK